MIITSSKDLKIQLQKKFFLFYLLFGNDPFLLLENEKIILYYAKFLQFEKYFFNFLLTKNIDWNKIYNLCLSPSLFSNRLILSLVLPEKWKDVVSISDNLCKLFTLLHNDSLLILKQSNQINKMQKNSVWFKTFIKQDSILINCSTPVYKDLYIWIINRAKEMQLLLDDSVCQFLCYCYEGNLLALVQTLKMLVLIFPQEKLTLCKIKTVVYDVSHFTVYQWIEAVLIGRDENKILHILRKLQLEGYEPILLLRSIQREILLILNIKLQICDNISIKSLFQNYKVWKIRQELILHALERLTISVLEKSIRFMMKIEFSFKKDFYDFFWIDLCSLSLLLSNKTFIDNSYN
ncbi:DNA polymerase III subunit delta [Candidatus Westeberhardia cardiocondylae]|uniref:DNA polymerase III subunit delta n=1 Tax=Candidatus Westeberhardia cardiocondylae TaxID=1594731 RepID=A0A0H5BWR6_9ENTR|nr:DNA polymerase III subunit delta [Candidatus Westeberhardia cardiocondylae]MCR3756348.1 DNA polymerase III subunit delta [Candidatus Westeberhardia cardiocondylae]CEN32165.1 DNA polymerase III subunit delta [Candidatus Westeberhardia cardiocondylae]